MPYLKPIMTTTSISFILFLLGSCSDAEVINPPYEYIDWIAQGEGYSSTYDNEHKYAAIGVIKSRGQRFPDGEGLCIAALSSIIERSNIKASMDAYNSTINPGETKVRHVKFRCVRALGKADKCVAEVDMKTNELIKQYNLKTISEAAPFWLAALELKQTVCRERNVVGEVGYVHASGYEDDRPNN